MNSSCVSPILESYNGKDFKKALAKKVARHEHFPFGQSPMGFVLPMKFTGSLKKNEVYWDKFGGAYAMETNNPV